MYKRGFDPSKRMYHVSAVEAEPTDRPEVCNKLNYLCFSIDPPPPFF